MTYTQQQLETMRVGQLKVIGKQLKISQYYKWKTSMKQEIIAEILQYQSQSPAVANASVGIEILYTQEQLLNMSKGNLYKLASSYRIKNPKKYTVDDIIVLILSQQQEEQTGQWTQIRLEKQTIRELLQIAQDNNIVVHSSFKRKADIIKFMLPLLALLYNPVNVQPEPVNVQPTVDDCLGLILSHPESIDILSQSLRTKLNDLRDQDRMDFLRQYFPQEEAPLNVDDCLALILSHPASIDILSDALIMSLDNMNDQDRINYAMGISEKLNQYRRFESPTLIFDEEKSYTPPNIYVPESELEDLIRASRTSPNILDDVYAQGVLDDPEVFNNLSPSSQDLVNKYLQDRNAQPSPIRGNNIRRADVMNILPTIDENEIGDYSQEEIDLQLSEAMGRALS